VRRGYAVVFIHVPEQKIVPPLNRFSARHHRSDAVLRVFLPSAGGEVAAVEP